MTDNVAVIDISHWQADPIDWGKIKASGVAGVILKCTESNNYVDPTFRKRYDAAIAAGLAVSTYHFLRPGNITAQMNWYLNSLKPRQGERVCLDHEDSGVSLADLESAVQYLETDSRDLQITIYSGNVIKEQLGSKHSDVLAETSLWLAQYGPTPSWPTGTWPTWTLWQFTDKGSVPGIAGSIDCNRFNGSLENCVAWLGPASAVPEPGPVPPDGIPIVRISIEAPDNVALEIVVNGELLA